MTTIRSYRANDRAACARMVHDAVHQGAAAFYTPEQRAAWMPSAVTDDTVPDRYLAQIALVAEDRGDIIGLMTLDPDRGYLDMAYVAPRAMGTGVAALLLHRLTKAAKERGLPRIDTHASHLARRFFMKNGWQVDAPETIARNGQQIERFCMSTRIGDAA